MYIVYIFCVYMCMCVRALMNCVLWVKILLISLAELPNKKLVFSLSFWCLVVIGSYFLFVQKYVCYASLVARSNKNMYATQLTYARSSSRLSRTLWYVTQDSQTHMDRVQSNIDKYINIRIECKAIIYRIECKAII